MTYSVAISAASVLFAAATWRGRQPASASSSAPRPSRPVASPRRPVDDPAASATARDDIAGAVAIALARLAPIITSQFVKIDVAVRPGLRTQMRGHALAGMLEELLAVVLHAAPASQLLVTAVAHGDRIDICVTDDMPVADVALRQGQVRTLAERVAARGDALMIDVSPGEGTTMTLRLAACSANAERPGTAAHGV
jgi:hypothetical protein